MPELRFPEFSGEWEEKKLYELTHSISSGKTKSNLIDEKGQYNIYGSVGVIGSTNKPDYEGKFVLIARVGAYAGKTNLINEKCGISDNTLIIKYKNELIPEFSFYHLENYNLNRLIFGSGQPLITGKQLKNIAFKIPKLKEQEKIASFLSKVDEKIQKLELKHKLWYSYKNEMLQQVFSQNVRFKAEDGSNFPDWKKENLGNLVSIPKKKKVLDVDDKVLITVKLHCKGIKVNDRIRPKITSKGRPYYQRNAGDLLIGRQNFHNGGIGIIPEELDGSICSNAITSLSVNSSKINKNYLLYYLSRKTYYKKSEIFMGGTGQKEISEKNLLELKVELPILPEQKKIANFLSSINQKIDGINKELQINREFKKGLLQKMFC